MTQDPCRDLTPLLVGRALGLSEGRDLERLAGHLTGCPECAGRDRQLGLAVAAAALPHAAPPAEGWERLVARIESEAPATAKPAVDGPQLRVTLTCTYCHDGLTPTFAHFCANCLAPHHEECFEKHGRCSAPGCGGSKTVHALEVADSYQRPQPVRWGRWAAVAAGLLVAALLPAGAAAYVYVGQSRSEAALHQERMGVLVAARDLRAGAILTEDDLETSEFPRAVLEQSLRGSWVRDRRTVVGAVVRTKVRAGQVLTAAQFASSGAGAPTAVDHVLLRYARARRLEFEKIGGDARAMALAELKSARRAGATQHNAWISYCMAEIALDLPLDPKKQEEAFVEGPNGAAAVAEAQALDSLRSAGAAQPGSPLSVLAAGREKELLGSPQEALDLYAQALEKDPTLHEASLARAALRLRLHDYGGALQDADPLTKDPMDLTYARALTLRAWARFHLGRDRQGALLDLDHALAVDPMASEALAYRAYVRLESDAAGRLSSSPEDRMAASLDAKKALRIDPRLPMAHRALAQVSLEEGERVKALNHASKAVRYASQDAWAYLLRARLRILDGDLDHGFLDLQKALTLDPDHARAMTLKAGVLVQRRDFDQARTLLARAIELDSRLAQAYFNRGYLNLMSRPRNYRKAIEDFSQAVGLAPKFADAYFYRAVAYHDQKRFEDCLSDLDMAVGLRDSRSRIPLSDVALIRGHCHYARAEWRPALGRYKEFVHLAPVGHAGFMKIRKRIKICEQKIAEEEGVR